MEFIGAIEKALGIEARKNFKPMQPGDMPATYADVSELTAWTGFKPCTPIDQGVAKFVAWFRAYYCI